MSHHIPSNTRGVPPSKGARTIATGVAMIASGFGLFFWNMNRMQQKKEKFDEEYPGAWPTWQFRLRQAANITDQPIRGGTMTLKASRIEPRSTPLGPRAFEHNNGHSVIPKTRAAATPIFDEHGDLAQLDPKKAVCQPAPQRDRGDGRPYTKSPDYSDVAAKRGKEAQKREL